MMFHIDTLRLIRKSFNRFFSLVMIVMIGVAFMMGLLSTRLIMEDSVDRYNDRYHLQDIQIYSSYGFDANDVAAIEQLEYVDRCFASKMIDVFSQGEEGNTLVTRVEETRRDVDQFELVQQMLARIPGRIAAARDLVAFALTVFNCIDLRPPRPRNQYRLGHRCPLFHLV